MNATEALDYLKEKGIILYRAGETLRVSPRSLVTPALSDLIQIHKPALLTLLRGESVEAPAVERQAEAAGGESHVPPAADSQCLVPAPCSHAVTYRRPSGVLVCLDCVSTLAPGATEWQRQQIAYCTPGQHMPYLDTPPDHPRQCQRCPYVWPQVTPEAPASTTPAQSLLTLPVAQHGEVPPQRTLRR